MLLIKAPYFTAAVVINEHGYVSVAAPILMYMKDWSKEGVIKYAGRKGWAVEQLSST